jgi:hypothetical protein
MTKRCPRCGEEKAPEAFGINRANVDGRASRCMPCSAVLTRQYRLIKRQDPTWIESQRARERARVRVRTRKPIVGFFKTRAHYSSSRYKAGSRAGLAAELARMWHRQRGRCALTGWRIDRESAHLDHIAPTSLGGSNEPSNLRWVHRDANMAKRALADTDFYRLCLAVTHTLRPRLVRTEQRALALDS